MFVHPSPLPNLEPIDGIPPFVADFLLDTTRAAVKLARSGTLERCPDVKFALAHAGGFVPYAAYRLASAATVDGDYFRGLSLFLRYYFDIALSGSPSALPSLLAFTSTRPHHLRNRLAVCTRRRGRGDDSDVRRVRARCRRPQSD